jgi:hypothetical protein
LNCNGGALSAKPFEIPHHRRHPRRDIGIIINRFLS